MKPLTPKGIITRNKIIHSARKLFFTNGFEETSVRSIVTDADVALGLFNHYFSSKNELAAVVLRQIWSEFDVLISQFFQQDTLENYLLQVLCTLRLQTKFPQYAALMIGDGIFDYNVSCVKDIYDKVHPGNTTPLYQKIILGNSILGIQQNLVNLGVQYPETYPFSLLAEYYIRQYVYFLDAENPDEIVRNTLSSFQKYHISLADSYTPIFARISGT